MHVSQDDERVGLCQESLLDQVEYRSHPAHCEEELLNPAVPRPQSAVVGHRPRITIRQFHIDAGNLQRLDPPLTAAPAHDALTVNRHDLVPRWRQSVGQR